MVVNVNTVDTQEITMIMTRTHLAALLFAVVLVTAAGSFSNAVAQKPVTQGESVTVTATIEAIDANARLITFKNEDGTLESIVAGPEVKRFDALKVGDKVTFRYYESVVYHIQKPGDAPPVPEAAATVRTEGAKPGGTMSRQQTAVVTVMAIDLKVPSVTIKNADGNTVSFKVRDKKNLAGVKAGDKVQITYTQALAVSVEAPGK
jgi:Cu/Ag efflux protein CusF